MTRMLFVWCSASLGTRSVPRCPASPTRPSRRGCAPTSPARPRTGRSPAGQRPARYGPPVTRSRYDAVVVGGGHNGLVAAAYLARAGRSVLVLERLGQVGGAAVSRQVFEGVDVRLSAYSYLVSLLPDRIVDDLGLQHPAGRPRPSPPTPRPRASGRSTGLLVERDEGPATAASFRRLTGSDAEFAGWQRFYGRLATLAEDLAPTLTEPLLSPDDLAGRLRDPELWHDLRERPLADVVADHLVRRRRPRRGAHRRPDRHLRRRARRRRPGRPLLPVPPGRQRHGALAGAGRRHGRGQRRDGRRRPHAPAPSSSPARRSPRWTRGRTA